MSVRKLLLLLGVVFVIAGLGLAMVWLNRIAVPPSSQTAQEKSSPALLTALHPLPSGTLLRQGDIGWKEISPAEVRPGQLLRGEVLERDFLGAITRRDFTEGEPLIVSELVKPSDRRFLAAVLRPGRRAVSISVDAPQTASGLVLPGDYVDVILTQNFGDNIAITAHRAVGETVLRNVRVVALDQSLGSAVKPGGQTSVTGMDARVPKTITLELDERQAQALFVATQLGQLQLAVRPLEGSWAASQEEKAEPGPTWASDVSQALRQLASASIPSAPVTPIRERERVSDESDEENTIACLVRTGSTLERLIRYPPNAGCRNRRNAGS